MSAVTAVCPTRSGLPVLHKSSPPALQKITKIIEPETALPIATHFTLTCQAIIVSAPLIVSATTEVAQSSPRGDPNAFGCLVQINDAQIGQAFAWCPDFSF